MMIWFGVQENYEDLFPRRHESYTYQRLLQVILSPPSVFKYFNTSSTLCAVHVKIILENMKNLLSFSVLFYVLVVKFFEFVNFGEI